MGLLDKVKENIQQTATMAKEGLEDLQAKRELSQAYGELGRKTFDLVDQGKLTAVDLNVDVEKIRKLRAEVEAEETAAGATGSASSTGSGSATGS